MKRRKIITILLIINLLLVGIIYNLITNENVNTKKQILKEMTETEYNNTITSLNTSHDDYLKRIEESKSKILSALTDIGVETSDQETFETITNHIKNLSSKHEPLLRQDLTFTKRNTALTIDCSSIRGYENLTEDNFFYKINSIANNNGYNSSNDILSCKITVENVKLTYDATTGILSINNGYYLSASTTGLNPAYAYPNSITVVLI